MLIKYLILTLQTSASHFIAICSGSDKFLFGFFCCCCDSRAGEDTRHHKNPLHQKSNNRRVTSKKVTSTITFNKASQSHKEIKYIFGVL